MDLKATVKDATSSAKHTDPPGKFKALLIKSNAMFRKPSINPFQTSPTRLLQWRPRT